jgi:KUP system potassium uptake protein
MSQATSVEPSPPHPATNAETDTAGHPHLPAHGSGKMLPLALAALGVVYGDIGTSPLYAVQQCFHSEHGVSAVPANVLGVLSLVFWSLMAVVSLKYLVFIMKADNRGEGGIFALLALIPAATNPRQARARRVVALAALFGAALLYGDGVITPAISVLSAVEGLGVATTTFNSAIVPITVVILIGLFSVQRRGTGHIGRIFGPVMLTWFTAIALLGAWQVVQAPGVFAALDPRYGIHFFERNGFHGFEVLGAVVLCITGGEALYADMGHFGRRPIRASWFSFVLPALLLNYFGQGALLLKHPEAAVNPFYGLVPHVLLYPMVALATVAAVIASQALISGAFSLTRQAVQMGLCPRVTVVHTSGEAEGQIFIPEVNTFLAIACILLVCTFRSSDRLGAAYGIAVTGTMAITSLVFYVVTTRNWGWPEWKALPITLLFLAFDLPFFGANVLKFVDGGWFPLAVASAIYVLMTTWKTGREELAGRIQASTMPLELLLDDLARTPRHRVRGTAVFLTSQASGAPPVLLHHLKHNQVLHEQVVLLSIFSTEAPNVPTEERLSVEELGNGFFRVTARYGFMQTPKIPEIMRGCRKLGLQTEGGSTSYYLGRETLLTHGRSRMARWRKVLFAFVSRNARPATQYFNIPPGRVVELGMQVDL